MLVVSKPCPGGPIVKLHLRYEVLQAWTLVISKERGAQTGLLLGAEKAGSMAFELWDTCSPFVKRSAMGITQPPAQFFLFLLVRLLMDTWWCDGLAFARCCLRAGLSRAIVFSISLPPPSVVPLAAISCCLMLATWITGQSKTLSKTSL
jgi:hypothetical protein